MPVLALALPTASVLAQEETTLQRINRALTKGGPAVLEEVIVSATKRDSALQQTGIAISVLGADDLEFRDMSNLEDIENAVPGLKIGTILGTPLINIRGVGLNFISGLGNPGVATHYDGVYLPRAGSAGAASVDLAQVEVLRGPQGTLYGRNATGGSINFISTRPAVEFGAGLTVGAGDYGREIYEGYLEGPVFNDAVAARVYLRRDHFDGYGINEHSGKSVGSNDATMGHVGVTWEPSENLALYVSYTRRDEVGAYPYSTPLTTVTPIGGGQPYPREEQTFEPYNTKALRQPSSDKSTDIGNITLTWDFGGYTLKSITGYVGHERYERLGAPEIERDVVYIRRDEQSSAISQEFNLSGEWFDGTLNWLLGAYYQDDDGETPYGAEIFVDELFGTATSLPTGLVIIFPPSSITRDISRAVFIDGYWSVLDSLRFVFGVRRSDEIRKFTQSFQPYVEDTQTGNPAATTFSQIFLSNQGVIRTCENESNKLEFTSTDPKFGIEWDVAEEQMVYLQRQSGFKAGGFDTSTGCDERYDPEEIKSWELGYKSMLLDGALTVNSALFDYDYSDYQVDRIEGFESVIENAASAKVRGFEFELRWAPVAWFALDSAYSYLDAEYEEYVTRDNFRNSSTFNQDAPQEDLSGNKISRSPPHSVNLGLTFSTHIGRFGLGPARLRLEGFYSDEVHFREFNREEEKQGAYHTYSAFFSVDSEDGKVSFSLFAKNITDERYRVGQIPFDTVKYRGAYYGAPSTWGATLSIRM